MALDGDPGSSWETKGFPQWVAFACPRPAARIRYQLNSFSQSAFMPKSWTVSASDDGKTWREVDSQSGQAWHFCEERTYRLAIDRPQRFFRLTFRQGNSPDTMCIPELRFFADP